MYAHGSHQKCTPIALKCHKSSKMFLGGVVRVDGTERSIISPREDGDPVKPPPPLSIP